MRVGCYAIWKTSVKNFLRFTPGGFIVLHYLISFSMRSPTRTLISRCCRTVHCERNSILDIVFTYRNIKMTGILVVFTSKPRAPIVHELLLLLGPSFEGFHYEKLYENFICIVLFSLYMSLFNVKASQNSTDSYAKHQYGIVMWICKLYVERSRWFIIS